VQVNSATVESGNRYSVTELVQHQQRTAVLTTPYVTSTQQVQSGQAQLESGQAAPGPATLGWTVLGFGPG